MCLGVDTAPQGYEPGARWVERFNELVPGFTSAKELRANAIFLQICCGYQLEAGSELHSEIAVLFGVSVAFGGRARSESSWTLRIRYESSPKVAI